MANTSDLCMVLDVSRLSIQELEAKRSYSILSGARRHAAMRNSRYSSETFREDLQRLISSSFNGREAYEWQLDIGEALNLNLNCLVIAGTGEGKTLFVMPLLQDKSGRKMVIIISPLDVLEEDQTSRFLDMNLTAVAVNGGTWTKDLKKEIEQRKHRAILTSPEMALKNTDFRQLMSSPDFSKDIALFVIDEAHCISQWGGTFRPEYGELGMLRALVPPTVPILAVSATLPPTVQAQVCATLHFNDASTFFLNLGNDCHNITPEVRLMSGGPSAICALDFVVGEHLKDEDTLEKTMIFCNTVVMTHKISQHLRKRLPTSRKGEIAHYHAHRSRRSKKRVMRLFRAGKIRVLVATEAARMGADISDVTLVVQYMVPASLSVWLQRAGRAARGAHITGRVILLVESSVYTKVSLKKKSCKVLKKGIGPNDRATDGEDPGGESGLEEGGASDDDDEGEGEGEDKEEGGGGQNWRYRKVLEIGLREWVETSGCRRLVADRYFANPRRRKDLTVSCCDNCAKTVCVSDLPLESRMGDMSRLTTPENVPMSSTHSTPIASNSPNSNVAVVIPKPRSNRCAKHLLAVRTALTDWQGKTWWRLYSSTSFGPCGLLPDTQLTTLASASQITTEQHLAEMKPRWVLARRHGVEVLDIVRKVDDDWIIALAAERAVKKAAKEATARQNKAARDEENRLRKIARLQESASIRAAKAEELRLKKAADVVESQRKKAEQEVENQRKHLKKQGQEGAKRKREEAKAERQRKKARPALQTEIQNYTWAEVSTAESFLEQGTS